MSNQGSKKLICAPNRWDFVYNQVEVKMVKPIDEFYDFSGSTAVITGGTGFLGAEMCKTLAALGAKVAILDINLEKTKLLASEINAAGGTAAAFDCNVLSRESIEGVAQEIDSSFGTVDILINAAGGNKPQATTSDALSFFDLPMDALRWVFDLNLLGTILPSQIFGKGMAQRNSGTILNISSMNAFRPLTRIPAYSAAKAGVSNFTQWLAVHLAQEYSPNIRVNAIAPGFFITDQNRFLLIDAESGELTDRGRTILGHTPMNRFGVPEDLLGTMLWLVSPASAFVTGIVVPVDGGFSAFSGV
jgi:NAD(P)-dependent dehydrogenase (short-subunit alcohol dehydrogenase family)